MGLVEGGSHSFSRCFPTSFIHAELTFLGLPWPSTGLDPHRYQIGKTPPSSRQVPRYFLFDP